MEVAPRGAQNDTIRSAIPSRPRFWSVLGWILGSFWGETRTKTIRSGTLSRLRFGSVLMTILASLKNPKQMFSKDRRFPFLVKSGLCWRRFHSRIYSKSGLYGVKKGLKLRSMLDFVLGGVLEASWSDLGRFFGRPRRAQDGPRWRQDGSRWRHDAPKTPRRSEDAL